jgi:FimV-like protein
MDQVLIKSYLNEALDIEIPLQLNLNDVDEVFSFSIASADKYRDFGINRPEFINKLEVTIRKSSDPLGSIIAILSKDPISHPSFILLIESKIIDQFKLEAIPINLDSRDVSYGYEIQEGDTLWSIAYKNRPGNDLTMNQMMIAVYIKNIDKFDSGIDDIQNGLMNIPTREFIDKIPNDAIFDDNNIESYRAILDVEDELEISNKDLVMDSITAIDLNEELIMIEVLVQDSALEIQNDNIEVIKSIEIDEGSLVSALVQEESIIIDVSQSDRSDKNLINNLSTNNRVSTQDDNLKKINNIGKEPSDIKFKKIIDFIDNFWALLLLAILLVISFLLFVISSFKKEKNLVMNLEKSIAMNEVATKLDLARAYVDMSDPEGAYEILEEVLNHGDKSQKLAAKKLLDALDK